MGERRRRSIFDHHEAQGEPERVTQEFQQVFRVTGPSPAISALARHGRVFTQSWDALRPNLETRAFEEAADEVRRQAVYAAVRLPRIHALADSVLDESDRYRIEAALDHYHYLDPKLLVFVAALRRAMAGQLPGPELVTAPHPWGETERLTAGAPIGMQPVELAPERLHGVHDRKLRAVYEDMVQTLHAGELDDGEARTLALWPAYMERVWQKLKPIVLTSDYVAACGRVRDLARSVATSLPFAVDLTRAAVSLGPDADTYDDFWGVARSLERLLPLLTVNVALLQLDRRDPELAAVSPYPPPPRTSM